METECHTDHHPLPPPKSQLPECSRGAAGQALDVWDTHPRNGPVAADHLGDGEDHVGDGEDTGRVMAHECKGTGRGERHSEGNTISEGSWKAPGTSSLPLTSYTFNPSGSHLCLISKWGIVNVFQGYFSQLMTLRFQRFLLFCSKIHKHICTKSCVFQNLVKA